LFHHCKEKNNNRSTTKTRTKKKEEKKRTTSKIGIPNVQKNMSTSLENQIEREREIKKEKVVVLLEEE
jgi:hypothetical protein